MLTAEDAEVRGGRSLASLRVLSGAFLAGGSARRTTYNYRVSIRTSVAGLQVCTQPINPALRALAMLEMLATLQRSSVLHMKRTRSAKSKALGPLAR